LDRQPKDQVQAVREGRGFYTVDGHASRLGSSDHNQPLSETRAKNFADAVADGFKIDRNRVLDQDLGESHTKDLGHPDGKDNADDRNATLQFNPIDTPPGANVDMPAGDVGNAQIHDMVGGLPSSLPDYSRPDTIKEFGDRGKAFGKGIVNLAKDALAAAKVEVDPWDGLKAGGKVVKDLAKLGFDLAANALSDRNAVHNLIGNYIPAYVREVENRFGRPSYRQPLSESGIGQLGDRNAGLQAAQHGRQDAINNLGKLSTSHINDLKDVFQNSKTAALFRHELSEELIRRLERRNL
jgi:hypothetical protein